jgi:glucosyl-dolichyl phosphate glucuronosyltransferase
MIRISVIVCTYNRADLLYACLESLCTQDLPSNEYEILVVDNASTDETKQIVQQVITDYPSHRVQYIYESQLGLGYARNTGYKQAAGEYITYLDDDALAPSEWLAKALELHQFKNDALCVGGKIIPFYTSPKPDWYKDIYATASWGDEPRLLKPGETFSGSNMIWRRTALENSQGFDTQVGVTGNELSLGEETVLFNQIWRQLGQPVFYYSPDLVVRHWVPPFKMKVFYRLKRQFISGEIQVYMHGPRHWYNRPGYFRAALWKLLRLTRVALRQRKNHERRENWLVEDCHIIAYQLGIVVASLGLRIRAKQK